jgi:hypothetical protein
MKKIRRHNMVRILRNLRIDEVAAVVKGANQGAKVLIRKMDDSDPRNWDWDDTPEGSYLFDDIMFGKQDDDDPQRTNTIDDDKKLSGKLREMVAAMITAVPSLSEEHAMHLSGPIGRQSAPRQRKPIAPKQIGRSKTSTHGLADVVRCLSLANRRPRTVAGIVCLAWGVVPGLCLGPKGSPGS